VQPSRVRCWCTRKLPPRRDQLILCACYVTVHSVIKSGQIEIADLSVLCSSSIYPCSRAQAYFHRSSFTACCTGQLWWYRSL
jgi:hypothetical protein